MQKKPYANIFIGCFNQSILVISNFNDTLLISLLTLLSVLKETESNSSFHGIVHCRAETLNFKLAFGNQDLWSAFFSVLVRLSEENT
jgi:hypothetical protein